MSYMFDVWLSETIPTTPVQSLLSTKDVFKKQKYPANKLRACDTMIFLRNRNAHGSSWKKSVQLNQSRSSYFQPLAVKRTSEKTVQQHQFNQHSVR